MAGLTATMRSKALFTLFILQQRMPVCSWVTQSGTQVNPANYVRRYGGSCSALGAASPVLTGKGSPPIRISDDATAFYSIHDFSLAKQYVQSGELSSIMLPHGIISDRIRKLSADIIRASEGISSLHMLCVLKGGSRFFHELTRYMEARIRDADLDLRLSFEFIKVRSYSGTQSTGKVEIQGLSEGALRGKHVILVEDIIDTGNTLRKVIPLLQGQQPLSLRVASLLSKRVKGMTAPGYDAEFVGFSIPDAFVVGFNMDYEERFRDIEHLCVLSEVGIERYRDAA